jgi:hypothetical protein
MVEYITLKIEKDSLEDHVRRICRGNLKKPAKICTQCPILGPVMELMKEYGWKYNISAMKEPLANYYRKSMSR